MQYKIGKSLKQYSIVDLLEVLQNNENPNCLSAKNELDNRNISQEDMDFAKKQLEIRIKSHQKEAQKPLSLYEKLVAFFVPFTYNIESTLKYNESEYSENHIESEYSEKFEMFGSKRKLEEFKKWRSYGLIFYLVIIVLYILLLLE